MELERYNQPNHKRHRFITKLLVFLAFLFVISLILFTSLHSDFSFTGNVIQSDPNNSFSISSETGIPELSLNGDYSQITLSGLKDSDIILGDKIISLNNVEDQLILYDFSGKISINKNSLNILEGKASKIVMNGAPLTNKNNKKLALSLPSPTNYNSLVFKESVIIPSIDFVTSGNVVLDGDNLALNKENLVIKGFSGNFKITENKLFLDGLVSRVDIVGKTKTISISK